MKRSEMLNLIANQLDFINGKFSGIREDFTEDELSKAEVILSTIESTGMLPPGHLVKSPLSSHEYISHTWEDYDEFESE